MTRKRKILTISGVVVILVLMGGAAYLRYIAVRAIPDYNKPVTLKGLTDKVTVYRDGYAVPHIYGENETDIYRTVGYVTAQDRLWQMDVLRRITTGRLAEIFGEAFVESDLLMRALRIPEKSSEILSRLDPKIKNALEAYADGVNQYLERNQGRLPLEFAILGYEPEPWRPIHSVNLIGNMAWDLTFAWSSELLLHKIAAKVDPAKFKQLIPNLPRQIPPVHQTASYRPAEEQFPLNVSRGLLAGVHSLKKLGMGVFDGSNSWVVSGKKSVTGRPILANDMHLLLYFPGTWYPIHQVVKAMPVDKLNVTGVLLPGQPFVVAGHNQFAAWGMTNVMADDLDFYLETIHPANPRQYKFNGRWRDMTVKEEIIRIRGGTSITEEIRFTHRGPIVSRFHKMEKEAVSMRWVGNEYSNEVRSTYLLNRAHDWRAFREALKTFSTVSQNIIYADVEGNIGIQTCAGLPIRKRNGISPAPGETDEYDWKGLVPFEELPFSYNPDCGYLASANNKTVGADYPHYISYWYMMPDRVQRIRDMLEEKEKLSVEDFMRMQGDVKSRHVERYLGDMIALLKKVKDLDAAETEALALFTRWRGVMAADSPAAALFEKFIAVLLENLVKDELGDTLYDEYMNNVILPWNLTANVWHEKKSPWCDNIHTDAVETFEQWVRDSFRDTVRALQKELHEKPGKWQWGRLHRFTLYHPLGLKKILNVLFNFNRGPFGMSGSNHTVCPYSYSLKNPFTVFYGASHRHVYSIADWDRSYSVIATGISGVPAARHYDDQMMLYLTNRYHRDFTDRQTVRNNARYTAVFSSDKK